MPSTPGLNLEKTKSSARGGGKSSDSARGKTSNRKSKSAKAAADGGGAGTSAGGLASIAEDTRSSNPMLLCAISPLVEVAGTKPLQLRAEFDLSSEKAGELASGMHVHVIEQRPTPDGAIRMAIAPEGTSTLLGWLTGISKDGKKNVAEIGRPVLEVAAAKPLAARDAFELTSGKAGELAVGAFVHVIEARATADGAWRIGYASEGTEYVKAWVTAVTKDGVENLAMRVGRRAAGAEQTGGGGGANGTARVADSPKGKRAGDGAAGADEVPPAAARLLLAARPSALIVAAKSALARKAFELNSDKVGELMPNTACSVVEERPNPDGSIRTCIALDGSYAPYGWITSITSSGAQNLRTTGRPLVEVTAAKALQARAEFELSSARAGEVAPGAAIHLLEVRRTADGAWRVAYSLEGQQEGPVAGWVTAVTKDLIENLRLRAGESASTDASPPIATGRGAGRASTARMSIKGGGMAVGQSPRSSTNRGGGPAYATAAKMAEPEMSTKAKADLALKEKRAKEEKERLALEAEEKRAFEEKAKKLSEEKAKKEQEERKTREEAQRKAKKESEEKRLEQERKDAETKLKAKKEYEQRIAAEKNAAAKLEEAAAAKLAAEAKARRDFEKKEKEKAALEKAATEKKKGDGGGAAADGAGAAEQSEEDKAAADAMMKKLRAAGQGQGQALTRVIRDEAKRPGGRPEGQPSRHECVLEQAAMVLMFNCYRSGYELSSGDISTMPESEALDMRSTKSMAVIGRLKIAPSKGTEFLDRIEFTNEWKVGAEHGLVHDGLQGDGELELRIDWKAENESTGAQEVHVALVKVNPWLAYGCAEGARLSMRKAGALEGRCATVQRTLRDDSVVVRVDGVVGESTVDPTPQTIVRTTNPRHPPNTRLLFVHENAAVDAEVKEWGLGQGKEFESMKEPEDIKEGSRHRLLVQGSTTTGWVTVSKPGEKEGAPPTENLKPAKPEEPENTQLVVCATKPLLVRSGFSQATDKVGTLGSRTVVNVLETRTMEDGTVRSMVSSVAGEAVLITAALNEFNHSVQRFSSVSEFEAARLNYLEDIVEREAMVEDAITGNMLRIKDQTLHVSTATDVQDNHDIPDQWNVKDVRDMVTLLLTASPNRSMGSHSAQPVLVRAGPGTGKTWMTKQAVFTLADRLRSGGGNTANKDGIRLVPVVVFVQRIVYLVREGERTETDEKFELLPRYIESVYSGKKYETWRDMLMQAYEMRALIVLLDGVDEAAGLRDQIEKFVHSELVPSGNRVLVTSRPEGVTLSLYKSRFVIMNLNELTNEQQRKVINIQMQGSQFFDHLLSLGEVRKGLDEAYNKLKEGVRSELEGLFCDDCFLKVDADEDQAEPEPKGGAAKSADASKPPKEGKGGAEGKAGKPDAAQVDKAAAAAAASVTNASGDGEGKEGEGDALEKRSFDPEQRLLSPYPERRHMVLQELLPTALPRSAYLEKLDKQMKSYTPQRCGVSLLDRLDAVQKLPLTLTETQLEAKILEDMCGYQGPELRHKIAVKFGTFIRKKRMADEAAGRKALVPAANYWQRMVARTDELYVLAAEMLPVFEFSLKFFVKEIARDSDDMFALTRDLIIGEVKDPVRCHEKANDEFASRFKDLEVAEACLTDVLRARVPCKTGTQVVQAVALLQNGLTIPVDKHDSSIGFPELLPEGILDGGPAEKDADGNVVAKPPKKKKIDPATGLEEVEVITLKLFKLRNKFDDLDPTHFRLAVCVLKMEFRGMFIFIELEVHYEDIMKIALNEKNQAYSHYNFFRERLKGTVPEAELDLLLEEKLVFLVDATGIPVLLSLLVLIFTSGGEDLTKLPSNRIELYELGIESAISKRLLRSQVQGDLSSTDFLVHEWMRLFNLDRGAAMVQKDEQKGGAKEQNKEQKEATQKKEREHKPTRKAQMKFEDLRSNDLMDNMDKKANSTSQANTEAKDKQVFKLTPNEVYEVFKHGAHYLREAVKPEVQRTELNRIELLMPKKLVDTVMMLVNANLKMLLGERAHSFGLAMLRNVAVMNQMNGRREFSSAHVAQALLLDLPNPEGLTLWMHLNKEEGGLPLTKTLEAQTEAAPAQYQFKHLSFQEGLFAQHLLLQAQDGWEGWITDETASKFLNNPFMNNTCRIAGGHLGSPLAKRRPTWDFSSPGSRLTETGLQALWLIMEKNDKLVTLNLTANAVGKRETDAGGIARMLMTSAALTTLSLGTNYLGSLKHYLRTLGRGLGVNKTLTLLDVSSNGLGPDGVRTICQALRTCTAMRRVDVSYNNPGREPALSELLRVHQGLRSIGIIEAEPMSRMERTFHLDARAKEMVGRALLESGNQLAFLQCDIFAVTEKTTSLSWKSAQQCDAVMLAGVLKANRVLTEITMAPGGDLGESEREELGRAMLANKQGKVGYCDIYGLRPGMTSQTFDLKNKEEVRSGRSWVLLCGLLRANSSLTKLTIRSVVAEHVDVLAEALQTNSTLQYLHLEHTGRQNEMALAVLPVQELNGNLEREDIDLWEAGFTVVDGNRQPSALHRWACAVVGSLLAVNQSVQSLRINPGSASDGGGVLEHLQRANKSTLRTLNLSKINLGDRGGTRFFESLQQGMCLYLKELKLSSNKLTDPAIGMLFVEVLRSEQCQIKSLDISNNAISAAVIARAIKLNRSLTALDMRSNPIEDDGLWMMGGLLLQDDCMCQLRSFKCYAFEVEADATELKLRDQQLEPGAYKLLAGVLKFNDSITDVDLSNTGLETQAACALAIALTNNTTVISADLSNNPLCVMDPNKAVLASKEEISKEFQGVYALAEAVHNNPTIQKIVLEGGELPVHNLKGLNTKTGRSLDLSRQSLTFVSSVFIGALVRDNATITELNLNTNETGPDGLTAIVNHINPMTLKTLDISNNVKPIGDAKLMTKDALEALRWQMTQQTEQLATLAESMGRMVGLEKLSLDKNQISEINSVGKMQSLKTFSISGNKLASLPEDLCQLRSLKKLAVHGNRLYELHTSIGLLTNLETLDLRSNHLTYLPVSIGQLQALKHLDIAENKLGSLVLSVCHLKNLERIDVKDNPLQKPPLSLAKQGIVAIRRYFQELVKSGETQSLSARLVLLGHGESGKTSLQRGLRAGAPRPAGKDERTIQLDIYSMAVGDNTTGQVLVSMWDLAGQPQYAAGLQPYIVPGSLYIMTVPAMDVAWLDSEYSNVLGRWMDYLQTGAPDAVVQLVLTHCDRLVPEDEKLRTHESFTFAAAKQIEWIQKGIERHQSVIEPDKRTLRVQETVACVSSIEGGEATLQSLRTRLETILLAKPPLLPSVGQTIPRTWILAMTFLRALRDGRDPIEAAKAIGPIDQRNAAKMEAEKAAADADKAKEAAARNDPEPAKDSYDPDNREMGQRAYMTVHEAKQIWSNEVAGRLGLQADAQVLDDALQLLVNQGEIFSSCGIIYLQPNYVVRLLKPLVDHRLGRQFFQKGQAGAEMLGGDPATVAQKAAMLLPAVDALVKSGELREELLPTLWEPLGLERDDYAEVLMMMSVSGVLFLAEHTQQGRRWVMPMRLPANQPSDAMWKWNEAMEQPEAEQLTMSYRIGKIAPPGIPERLTASCYGFGKYHRFWKFGALIETRTKDSSPLLLELRRPQAEDGSTNYELCVEMRGRKLYRGDFWAILLQVKDIADVIINDFPGLEAAAELSCPTCSRSAEHRETCTRWPVDELQTRAMICPTCQEQVALSQVAKDTALAIPKSLNLSLALDGTRTESGGGTGTENKYLAEKIRFGRPIEGAQALHKLLGLQSEDDLKAKMVGGEAAIVDEIEAQHHATLHAPGGPQTDEYGWTDKDWLVYLRSNKSRDFSRNLPLWTEESLKPKPEAFIDHGNVGMSLDDFCALPSAVAAGLKRSHVLALRLYSSSVFRKINLPLHDGCTNERPHPYPALVALLAEAIKKLRAAAAALAAARPAQAAVAAAAAAAVAAAPGEEEPSVAEVKERGQRVLWRGMCNLDVASEFKQRGGTELTPMSTSTSRSVSEKHVLADVAARRLADPGEQAMPLLLKVRVDSPAHAGADVRPFSVYADENEFVYPPCTYLEPRSEKEETVEGPDGKETTIKIIEVLPQIATNTVEVGQETTRKPNK